MQVRASGGALGAVVTGVDLAAPPGPDVVARLRAAWLEHLVLVFPDQQLDPGELVAAARLFGEPSEYPMVPGLPGEPFVNEVKKLPHEVVNFGGLWHSDTVYLEEPPMASLLHARVVPSTGGDTQFANMYAAWQALPVEVREVLADRAARNSSGLATVAATRADRIAEAAADAPPTFESRHPVARMHPETGRIALYVNPAHTWSIDGLGAAASRDMLDRLFAHQVQDRFVWQLRWEPGTLAIWDNRCTLHHPLNDYPGQLRVMHRVTLRGSRPVGPGPVADPGSHSA